MSRMERVWGRMVCGVRGAVYGVKCGMETHDIACGSTSRREIKRRSIISAFSWMGFVMPIYESYEWNEEGHVLRCSC